MGGEKKKRQMSEAFVTSIFLALSGGLQDAYTYCIRDGVFANAQTGNVVLMSQYLMQGNFSMAGHYAVPLLSFAFGVFVAEKLQARFKYASKLHWRQGLLVLEIVLLVFVGFLPETLNVTASSIVSFVCAMQGQAFRKVNGYSYASTMCIGNMRSGVAALSAFHRDRKKEQLREARHYFGVIGFFAAGAAIGSMLVPIAGIATIFVSAVFLSVSFVIMFLD